MQLLFYLDRNAYVIYREGRALVRDFDCSYADTNGYVLRYRWYLWKMRIPVPKGYVVHHKDGDTLNDDPSNLQVMLRGEHTTLHSTGHRHTEETKKVLRKYSNEYWTDERCLELSKKYIGRPPNTGSAGYVHSKETRAAISRAASEVVHSEETRAKISRALSGRSRQCSRCGGLGHYSRTCRGN